MIARGGRGGRGNRRFTTAARQAPRTAEVGEEGESAELELRLKMVCDAALLGFPNAGKSSLLRRISNATPEGRRLPVHDARAAARHGRARTTCGSSRSPTSPACSRAPPTASGSGTSSSPTSSARCALRARGRDRSRGGRRRSADCRAALRGHLRRAREARRRARRAPADRRAQQARPASARPTARRSCAAFAGRGRRAAGCRRTRSCAPRRARRPFVLGLSCATGAGRRRACAARSSACSPRLRGRSEPPGADEDELADYLVYRPRGAPAHLSASCATTASCASRAARSCALVDEARPRQPKGVRALASGARAPRAHRCAAPCRGQAAATTCAIGDERFEFHARRPRRPDGTTTAATTRRTISNGEHRHRAHRRLRLALQPAPPRPSAALPGGDLAARPGARRARADGHAAAPARARRARRACACGSRRRRPSATRR